jgi:thiol-disulfide isomerase/thioredoxin
MYRREVLIGVAAALAAGAPARANVVRRVVTETAPLFSKAPWRTNRVAFLFETPPFGLSVPTVRIEGPTRAGPLVLPRQGLTLLSLWAPWATPCLSELADLDALQQRYAGDRFRVLPVLTNPRAEITVAEAGRLLVRNQAEGFKPLIERGPSSKLLFDVLAGRPDGQRSLPCHLIVRPDGRVLARQFGAPVARGFAAQDVAAMARIKPGDAKPGGTLWASPDGDALVRALAQGAFG